MLVCKANKFILDFASYELAASFFLLFKNLIITSIFLQNLLKFVTSRHWGRNVICNLCQNRSQFRILRHYLFCPCGYNVNVNIFLRAEFGARYWIPIWEGMGRNFRPVYRRSTLGTPTYIYCATGARPPVWFILVIQIGPRRYLSAIRKNNTC